jgi:transposase
LKRKISTGKEKKFWLIFRKCGILSFSYKEKKMPKERLTVRKIREILRLRWELQLSERVVARSCRISHSTVGDYVKRAETAGLKWPLSEDLSENQLYELLFPRTEQLMPNAIPMPDWEEVSAELRRKGVTLRLLWMEYLERFPNGYSYSQFCQLYRDWSKKLKPTMRLNHKAGEKVFVDYAGQTMPVVDPKTGEIREAEIFVAVLGASSYTYAEAHWHQDLPNWIGGHVRAIKYFGGVPEIVVPDNLKAGVSHPSRYDPEINPTYQEMAEHYGVAVIPARVRRPRDKSKAEVGVQNVERWILARLRNRKFFSLFDLNRAMGELLKELNDRKMEHLGKSRRELFELYDRPALNPLPTTPYEFAFWKKARINIDYHVEYEGHYYSVPHHLYPGEVYIRANEKIVEIFLDQKQVALHPRSNARGRHSTLKEHMPTEHRFYNDWSKERFIQWAEKIGPETAKVVQLELESRQHPEQAYRACLGILGFTRKYTAGRMESACHYALANEIHSYRGIKNILVNKFDQLVSSEDAPQPSLLSPHINIRGKDYYN